mgnify:CR=1 FL=1
MPEQKPELQGLRTWTPRLIGFAAALGVALSFYRAASGYARRSSRYFLSPRNGRMNTAEAMAEKRASAASELYTV